MASHGSDTFCGIASIGTASAGGRREQARPAARASAGELNLCSLAFDPDARRFPAAPSPTRRARGQPVPHPSGRRSENLTTMEAERTPRSRRPAAQFLHLEDRPARVQGRSWGAGRRRGVRPSSRSPVGLFRLGDGRACLRPAVAEHRDPIADQRHFGKVMRDVDDADARAA